MTTGDRHQPASETQARSERTRSRWGRHAALLAWGLFGVAAVAAMFLPGELPPARSAPPVEPQASQPETRASFATMIRQPEGNPALETDLLDAHGKRITVACAVCHTTKPSNGEALLGTELTNFHLHLQGDHGKLSCVSCHNPVEGYGSMRLADGKSVPYREVMRLCAQCHGPQYRDYQHGAHGGMAGFWDTTRGARTRNNCVDCHAPHAPKYRSVRPAAGPQDRFLTPGNHDKGNGHE